MKFIICANDEIVSQDSDLEDHEYFSCEGTGHTYAGAANNAAFDAWLERGLDPSEFNSEFESRFNRWRGGILSRRDCYTGCGGVVSPTISALAAELCEIAHDAGVEAVRRVTQKGGE